MYIKCILANKVVLIPILLILIGLFLPKLPAVIIIMSGIYTLAFVSGFGFPTYTAYKYTSSIKNDPNLFEIYCRASQRFYCNTIGVRIAKYEVNNNHKIPWIKALLMI